MNTLSMSPTEFCEFLRVHPSAWFRWSNDVSTPTAATQRLVDIADIIKRYDGGLDKALARPDITDFKAWRTARGFSQGKIAALLQVHKMTYLQWETGRRRISGTVIRLVTFIDYALEIGCI